mmetsp:Transcript_56781/g.182415  ORF Transcript_56781/g.182415 Transcript_56781/m.182415 type:complete len:269 (-) Transcript_56781:2868-3674(-)
MVQWAPLSVHHWRTFSANFGVRLCCSADTTNNTASFAPASRATRSSSSSRAMRSASSFWRCSSSSAESSATGSSSGGRSASRVSGSGSSCRRMRSCQTSTMRSPHIKRKVATIMGTSLPVSPHTRLGPSATCNCSLQSRHLTPLPLSKERPPIARGKSSMSVPVSCRSSSVPSGSSSSFTRRTAAIKRRLSGSGTVPAGSLRAIVTSPNFRCSPEPMPRNFMFPGNMQSAMMRRCSSSTSSRWAWGSSSASSTRCVAWLKYSRPLEPV